MKKNVECRELLLGDISKDLLNNFDRYQEIKKSWQNENGIWTLVDDEYVINMDNTTKENEAKYFLKTIKEGGFVFGAFDNSKLIGYSVLLNYKFGSMDQYIELKLLHISSDYRGMGIGKKLFQLCVEKAKSIGIKKIYISANSSEGTINFYLGIGCIDAVEINNKIFEKRPKDRQMEYVL